MNGLARLGRLWRTVRWLRPTQVLGRLRLHLQRPRPDQRPAPACRSASGTWIRPPARQPSLLGPTRLRFLGETHDVAEVGWDSPEIALLWRYNLHYFDDLNAVVAANRHAWHVAFLDAWVRDNPPGRGTAWAPYPASLRIVNWIKWSLGGAPMGDHWLHSLAIQVRWLTRRLEWHLLGNHLFVNAKALVFAGLYFTGTEADAWLETGLAILRRELPEQILADGAQFERSPMYHALALEDLLDLLNVITALAPRESTARALVPELRRLSSAMLHWLRCMRHAGGGLARFNDSAEGIAPDFDALQQHAAALGIEAAEAPQVDGLLLLQPSGYVRARFGNSVALLDVAPIGPDYLPGHAHADTLSFELSIERTEVVVNRGTSVYGVGARRHWERGTAAHSTVQIGNHDSSEVWSGFRVGRRARPLDIQLNDTSVEASHDGYRHLPGGPLHRRRWHFGPGQMEVIDQVTPVPREATTAHWHFAPGLQLAQEGRARWRISDGHRTIAVLDLRKGSANLHATLHALRFGELVEAPTLAVRLDDGHADICLTWTA